MLTVEEAKKRLLEFQYPQTDESSRDDADDEKDGDNEFANRFLKGVAALPAKVRTFGYHVLGRAADGSIPQRDSNDRHNWQATQQRVAAIRREFDQLPAKTRRPLLELFFPRMAGDVEHALQFLKSSPYELGYTRKGFRAPNSPEYSLDCRYSWLESLIDLTRQYRPEVLTPAWVVTWAPFVEITGYDGTDKIGRLAAAVIDKGGKQADEVFEILCQSGRNEHPIGAMGRHVTRGLLLSPRPEGWEFIEKMLIAAQRQEGLRQTILESVDECHPQAFRRMLKLIVDNGLVRFSAVVRAANVWLGYNWDSPSAGVVNTTLKQLISYLEDPKVRDAAIAGKDPEAAHLALCAVAFDDTDQALPLVDKMMGHAKPEFRFVAATVASHLGGAKAKAIRVRGLEDEDLRVVFQSLVGLDYSEDGGEELEGEGGLFERLEGLYRRLPEHPLVLKPVIWPWTGRKIEREIVAHALQSALGERSPTLLIPYLSSFGTWQRRNIIESLAAQKTWDAATRASLISSAGDSSADVRSAAFTALLKSDLQPAEVPLIEAYLTRKSADLRRGSIALLAQQKAPAALAAADRLLAAKDGQQRLAGLEVLRCLAEGNKDRAGCQSRAEAYAAKAKKLSKDEETQIAAIRDSGKEVVTIENALGLMDPAQRSPRVAPKPRKAVMATPAAVALLQGLDDLIHQHRDTPIRVTNWRGEESEMLLGASGWQFPSVPWRIKNREKKLAQLPLREMWETWLNDRPKKLRDGDGLEVPRAKFLIDLLDDYSWGDFCKLVKKERDYGKLQTAVIGEQTGVKLKYPQIVERLLGWIELLAPPPDAAVLALDVFENACASVSDTLHQKLIRKPGSATGDNDDDEAQDWRETVLIEKLKGLLRFDDAEKADDKLALRHWNLLHWYDEPIPGATRDRPSLDVYEAAHRLGVVTETDWYDALLGPRVADQYYGVSFGELASDTIERVHGNEKSFLAQNPGIAALVDRAVARVLDVELARGASATPATRPALSIRALEGLPTLIRLLGSMGKEKFLSNVGYRSDAKLHRFHVLTHLIEVTRPAQGDTPEAFCREIKALLAQGVLPEERVLELAFLAPQWLKFVAAWFNWNGFEEAFYWFMAHMASASGGEEAAQSGGYQADAPEPDADDSEDSIDEEGDDSDDDAATNDQKPEPKKKLSAWDRMILERTPLTDQQRREGAIDVAWFQRVYALLSRAKWEQMAAAARFAASAADARRTMLITDVLLGKASRKELIADIRTKKLKERVRLLGLMPLAAGPKGEADLRERFKILMEYKRYAGTLSGLTKPEAMRSLDVGLRNLAQTAGFSDPLRLEWALGADEVADLAKGPVVAKKDNVVVTLSLDEQSKPMISVSRAGKPIKAPPPAIKKDKKIAELYERTKDLKRQASQMRQSLESAMCRQDTFTAEELVELCRHPMLAPLVTRLVFVGEGVLGYPDKNGKALRNPQGKLEPVKKKEVLRIAHSYDLYHHKNWA
ncbi:MAG: DUF5724 domain-containing protein, partial [Planctomycetota bacterium]|nr:DUF5724 domain-containing protein [Planctomycetota bacterium]